MKHEITFEIPSIAKIEKAINTFSKIDWDSIDINNLNKEIDPSLFALHLFIMGAVKPPEFVYRSRGLSTFTIEDNLCSLDSYKYPPKNKCRMNRLNLDKIPVFYSSLDIHTAIVECDTPDSVYFVSRWKFISDSYRYILFAKSVPSLSSISFNIDESIDRFGKVSENVRLLYQFYETQFVKQIEKGNEYKFTAYISNKLLVEKNKIEVDAIIYPSIRKGTKYVNLAFSTSYFDKNIQLDRIYMITNTSKKGKGELVYSSVGEIKNGNVKWRVPEQKDFEQYCPQSSKRLTAK